MNANPYALLVEDDPNTSHLIQTILAECSPGLKVERVEDGEEALDFLRGRGPFDGRDERPPAVLLVDIEMPRMDGIELLREVKGDAQLKHLPVVVMAGAFSDAKVYQCYEHGANALVVKPVNYADFAGFVRTLGQFWLTMNQPPRTRAMRHRL